MSDHLDKIHTNLEDVQSISAEASDSQAVNDYLDFHIKNSQYQQGEDTRLMRKDYAKWSFLFALITIVIWGLMSVLLFVNPTWLPGLTIPIYAAFTTACTINILAAFLTVIKGLFTATRYA